MLLTVDVARPADGVAVAGDERAVLQAIAGIINQEASRPYERLYFETRFDGAPFVASSLTNADRATFCGVSREEALKLVSRIQKLGSQRVEIDKELANTAGFKLGEKKNPRFPYVILSRVIFGPGKLNAWVGVEMNGVSGSIMRLDKVGDAWNKTDRCGGWLKAQE